MRKKRVSACGNSATSACQFEQSKRSTEHAAITLMHTLCLLLHHSIACRVQRCWHTRTAYHGCLVYAIGQSVSCMCTARTCVCAPKTGYFRPVRRDSVPCSGGCAILHWSCRLHPQYHAHARSPSTDTHTKRDAHAHTRGHSLLSADCRQATCTLNIF